MTSFARPFLLSLAFLGAPLHAAEPAYYLGKPDCRIAPVMSMRAGHAMSWSGACKDTYAEGKGVLEWRVPDLGKWKLEAVLVRGEITGEATMTYDAGKYIGAFRDGVPNGLGYFNYTNTGNQYEGGVVDVKPEGQGVMVAADGSTYEGGWKKGKRHGRGKASFKLGGSYDGEWREGEMHGQGKIVYNGGRVYEGEFVDGRPLGAAPIPAAQQEAFPLKDEFPSIGSLMRRERAIGFAPLDLSWQQLSAEQQAIVRNGYPALDDGDEPPYPLKGARAWYRDVADMYRKFTDYRGTATVYVTVSADGAPTSVSTYGVNHPEFGRYLGIVAMMQRFKPARCAGKPCEMIYPIKFVFTVSL